MKTTREWLAEVFAKYPSLKKTKHSGDSYLIYEAGQRDLFHPFGKEQFDRVVEENEGAAGIDDVPEQTDDNWRMEGCENYDDAHDVCLDEEANSDLTNTVNRELTDRMAPFLEFPVWDYTKDWDPRKQGQRYENNQTVKENLRTSYPREKDWWQKALSQLSKQR